MQSIHLVLPAFVCFGVCSGFCCCCKLFFFLLFVFCRALFFFSYPAMVVVVVVVVLSFANDHKTQQIYRFKCSVLISLFLSSQGMVVSISMWVCFSSPFFCFFSLTRSISACPCDGCLFVCLRVLYSLCLCLESLTSFSFFLINDEICGNVLNTLSKFYPDNSLFFSLFLQFSFFVAFFLVQEHTQTQKQINNTEK